MNPKLPTCSFLSPEVSIADSDADLPLPSCQELAQARLEVGSCKWGLGFRVWWVVPSGVVKSTRMVYGLGFRV